MTPHDWALLGIGIATTVIGWFCRELYDITKALRTSISALEVKIATDYVPYDRLQDAFKPFFTRLDRMEEAQEKRLQRLEDLMAHKMDKP